VLSSKHERVVRNDNTVTFKNLILQLPSTRHRIHFVRCPVTVHQFANGTLGVSYQGRLLACYDVAGEPLPLSPNKSAPPLRNAGPAQLAGALQRTGGRRSRLHIFPPALKRRLGGAGGKMFVDQATNQSQEENERA
jgi:hypothetical protein